MIAKAIEASHTVSTRAFYGTWNAILTSQFTIPIFTSVYFFISALLF